MGVRAIPADGHLVAAAHTGTLGFHLGLALTHGLSPLTGLDPTRTPTQRLGNLDNCAVLAACRESPSSGPERMQWPPQEWGNRGRHPCN